MNGTMTLTEARTIAANSALRTTTANIGDARLDYAIMEACAEFVRRTRCVQSFGAITLPAETKRLDMSGASWFPEFNANRIIGVEVEDADDPEIFLKIDMVDYSTVAHNSNPLGGFKDRYLPGWRPVVAFGGSSNQMVGAMDHDGKTLAIFTPFDTDRELRVHWWKIFQRWNPATVNPTTRILTEIPDEYIGGVLLHGVPMNYDNTTLEAGFTDLSRKRFEDLINQANSTNPEFVFQTNPR